MSTLLLCVIYASFISLGLPDAMLGAGWPAMRLEFGVPVAYAGILQMIISAGTIVSSMNSGKILRRFGTGRVTAVSVCMTALALAGFSYLPSFYWLILAAIPLGLGAGSVDAGLNAYVAAHYESRHMSWLHSFWGVGALSGPIVISFALSRSVSWRMGYASIAAVQALLVVVLAFTLPLWDRVRLRGFIAGGESGGESNGKTALRGESSLKSESSSSREPVLVSEAHLSLASVLRIKGVPFALASFLLYCGIESSMGLWSASFLVGVRGVEPASAARWASAFYASITLGRFITGFLTFRVRNEDLIRGGAFLILCGVISMLLPLHLYATFAGIILVGLGCAPIFPCMLHLTPARFGANGSQSVMGVQMAFAYVGSTCVPPSFGALSSYTGLAALPLFALALACGLASATELARRKAVSGR